MSISPLQLLQNDILSEKWPAEHQNLIIFSNGFAYPSSTKSQIQIAKRRNEFIGYFTLEDLLFLAKNRDKSFGAYRLLTSNNEGISNIPFIIQFNNLKDLFSVKDSSNQTTASTSSGPPQPKRAFVDVLGYDPNAPNPKPTQTDAHSFLSQQSKTNPWLSIPLDDPNADLLAAGPMIHDNIAAFQDISSLSDLKAVERSLFNDTSTQNAQLGASIYRDVSSILTWASGSKLDQNSSKNLKSNPKRQQTIKARLEIIPPRQLIPIILVPSSSDVINQLNFKDILIDGKMLTTDQARETREKSSKLNVYRPQKLGTTSIGSNGRPKGPRIQYQIIERPELLSGDDWKRVVAVLLLGDQEWQFNKFPWSSPAAVFQNVAGFFFQFDNRPTPKALNNWPITIFKLPSNPRVPTFDIALRFWSAVDSHVKSSHPDLSSENLFQFQQYFLHKEWQKMQQRKKMEGVL